MNTLDKICADKRAHIAQQKTRVGEAALIDRAKAQEPARGFAKALSARIAQGKIALIAEIKKASPSKGLIRADFNPASLAAAYEAGGATCLSVLTDAPYFQGRDAYLAAARSACALPVLRKDFMLDPYQIVESRALGADCVLLILAALSNAQAAEMEATAKAFGMDALIEVHDEAEMDRALDRLSSPLLGINNRDLKTLRVDLAVSERMANRAPAGTLLICESGISTHAEVTRMQNHGMHAFLVGESLMRQNDVIQATQTLLGEAL